MSRFEILSFQFDEFVECVWTLNIKALNLRVDAYDNTYRSPERSYPAGTSIEGELIVAFIFGSSCSKVKEQCFKFFNLNPSGKFASGSGVTCIGKILARRDDGDYEFDCGTNLRLAFEDKTELHPGDWVEVTGPLYFDPDFSTLVMPRKTPRLLDDLPALSERRFIAQEQTINFKIRSAVLSFHACYNFIQTCQTEGT